MSNLTKIKANYSKFSKTEKKVADYFLQNAENAEGQAIEIIANNSKVSKATVMRFSKTLGYSGYREFIMRFSAGRNTINPEHTPPLEVLDEIKEGDSVAKIMGHILATNSKSIEQTMSICDPGKMELAAQIMHSASRIDFFGAGASSLVAQDGQQKFVRINKVSYSFSDSHMQVTVTSTLTRNDICFVISYSGETASTLQVAETAKACGAYVVSITKFGDNPISRIADIALFVSSPEIEFRSAATGSRIAQLSIIDALYAAVLNQDYQRAQIYLDASRDAVQSKRVNKG